MTINQAMYSGVTGLNANSDGMSVISNNIANANTRSFKSARAEFEDMLTVSLNENSQLGRGARLRDINTNFSQGSLATTGGITDFAIQGDGFFIVRNSDLEVQESNGKFYTRQGSFRFDKDGYLTDVNGSKVQGYMADKQGKLNSRLSDLQVTSSTIPPSETNVVTVNVNLDVRERPPHEEFDPKRPTETSNHNTTVTVYDSMGRGHIATVYFSRVADGEKNVWKWHCTVDGNEVVDSPGKDEKGNAIPAIVAQGELEFDAEGKPVMEFRTKNDKPSYIDMLEKSDAHEVEFSDGARPQKIQFNFGPMEDENGNLSNQMSSSMATKSTTVYHSQNGYEAGTLKSLKVDLDGSIRGIYTNGLERRLGSLALATFPNNHGLQKVGRNSFIGSPKSGEPRIGVPQTGSRGSVYSASLEESNVDLAQQFVDMILTQRGFQANSKSITTSDSMLEEIINLKR